MALSGDIHSNVPFALRYSRFIGAVSEVKSTARQDADSRAAAVSSAKLAVVINVTVSDAWIIAIE